MSMVKLKSLLFFIKKRQHEITLCVCLILNCSATFSTEVKPKPSSLHKNLTNLKSWKSCGSKDFKTRCSQTKYKKKKKIAKVSLLSKTSLH